MFKKIFFVLLFFYFLHNSVFAKNAKTKFNKNQPLNITSESVEIFREKNEIIFIENVKAVQDNFVLYADKMVVKYIETTEKKLDIKSIKTEKNVRFISKDIKATANQGFYDVSKNILTLMDDVTATESGITVYAKVFEYDINTGRAKIIGNKKQNERVTLILDNIDDIKNKH